MYFWNLRDEKVSSSITIPKTASILDVCEIEHLKSICVSIMTTSE